MEPKLHGLLVPIEIKYLTYPPFESVPWTVSPYSVDMSSFSTSLLLRFLRVLFNHLHSYYQSIYLLGFFCRLKFLSYFPFLTNLDY